MRSPSGSPRTRLDAVVRIAIAFGAGFILGGAGGVRLPGPGPAAQASQPPACHSRSDCGASVIGGLRIAFTGWACTTGFVARDTHTGDLVVLTAGHCIAGSGLTAQWTHHGVAIGLATADAFHPGSNADVGAIELTDQRPSDAIYGSGDGDVRPVTGLASDASQAIGTRVCRSGATSGWRCGSVDATDVDATLDGRLIHHTWWIDFPSATGDSGSPVVDLDGRAAGILIATTQTRSLYSTVDWIANELGVGARE
jgi:hypothetical protein